MHGDAVRLEISQVRESVHHKKDRTVVERDISQLEEPRDDRIARREQEVARRTDAGRRSRG